MSKKFRNFRVKSQLLDLKTLPIFSPLKISVNNHLTLRFQKESFCSRSGGVLKETKIYTELNRTFIDYNFYLSKQFITRSCSFSAFI